MKIIFLLCILIIINTLSNTIAMCEDGQIDINSASLEELDKLYGIGPAKAQAIIDTRPFERVDDLIGVNGIGEVTLANIKQQGLACVDGEEEDEEESGDDDEELDEEEIDEKEEQEETEEKEIEKERYIITNMQEATKITGEIIDTITLNPKGIKSEIDKEQLNKNKLATYGLIAFSVLLVVLFGLKRKKDKKNEFN